MSTGQQLVLEGLRRIRNELGGGPGTHYSIVTWELAEELERDHSVSEIEFAQHMRELTGQGDIEASPMVGSLTNWHVTSVK